MFKDEHTRKARFFRYMYSCIYMHTHKNIYSLSHKHTYIYVMYNFLCKNKKLPLPVRAFEVCTVCPRLVRKVLCYNISILCICKGKMFCFLIQFLFCVGIVTQKQKLFTFRDSSKACLKKKNPLCNLNVPHYNIGMKIIEAYILGANIKHARQVTFFSINYRMYQHSFNIFWVVNLFTHCATLNSECLLRIQSHNQPYLCNVNLTKNLFTSFLIKLTFSIILNIRKIDPKFNNYINLFM